MVLGDLKGITKLLWCFEATLFLWIYFMCVNCYPLLGTYGSIDHTHMCVGRGRVEISTTRIHGCSSISLWSQIIVCFVNHVSGNFCLHLSSDGLSWLRKFHMEKEESQQVKIRWHRQYFQKVRWSKQSDLRTGRYGNDHYFDPKFLRKFTSANCQLLRDYRKANRTNALSL